MGILGSLNPFTFSRKSSAAWNALMAAYTFDRLPEEKKREVMDKVVEIESSVKGRPVTVLASTAQRYYFFSLAMMNLGIVPALGKDLWHEVKNPYTDILGADEIIASTKHQLEKQYGVEIPIV